MDKFSSINPNNDEEDKVVKKLTAESVGSNIQEGEDDIFEGDYGDIGFVSSPITPKFVSSQITPKYEQVYNKLQNNVWVRDRELEAALKEITKQIGKDPEYKDPDYIFDRDERIEEFLRRRNILYSIKDFKPDVEEKRFLTYYWNPEKREAEVGKSYATPLELYSDFVQGLRNIGEDALVDIFEVYAKVAYDKDYIEKDLDRVINYFEPDEVICGNFGEYGIFDDTDDEYYWWKNHYDKYNSGKMSKTEKIVLLDMLMQTLHTGHLMRLHIYRRDEWNMDHVEEEFDGDIMELITYVLGVLSSEYPVEKYEYDKSRFHGLMKDNREILDKYEVFPENAIDESEVSGYEKVQEVTSALTDKGFRVIGLEYPTYLPSNFIDDPHKSEIIAFIEKDGKYYKFIVN